MEAPALSDPHRREPRLTSVLRHSSQVQDCAMSVCTNCAPIDSNTTVRL
jgi:hypothetical protein